MIGCPCLCTGADSTHGIDSILGIDSSPGIDSTLESIPCDSDSGSFSMIPVMIPVPEKNGIITPLVGTVRCCKTFHLFFFHIFKKLPCYRVQF